MTSLNATDERNGIMFKSLSTSLIVRGILAVGVGIIALAWPQVTVFALVILFAMLAFVGAAQEAVRAFSSTTARPVIRHLLLGLIDAAAGVLALLWPAPTALVLVLIVASWAVVSGLFEFFTGFRRGELAGRPAQLLLGGLVSIVFGAVLFARPDIGAITLALLFGMFNLIYGAWQITLGIELRQTAKAAHSAAEMTTPPRSPSQPRAGATAA
jgi:uncharacterized membrane protein HdeD (DUF308 family)